MIQTNPQTKQCSDCKQYLPLTDFGKRKQSKDGLQYKCKKCRNKSKKEKLYQSMVKNRNILTSSGIHKNIKTFLHLDKSIVNIQFNSKYINPTKIKNYINVDIPAAIESVMGTGKTKYVIEICKQSKRKGLSVIYICPNISTVKDTEIQLNENGIETVRYNETQYFDEVPHNTVILSTVDSSEPFLDRDILIVDEVYTVFEEMAFKVTKDEEIQNRLLTKYHKIMKHRKVFVLDRYINPILNLFDVFQRDFEKPLHQHLIIQNLYKKEKYIFTLGYDRQRDLTKEILHFVSEYPDKLTIHFSEERSAKGLYTKLKEKGFDVGIFTGKNKDKLFEFKNKKIKISTSSLSRGVSLNGDAVYLIDSGRTVGVMTLLQMIDRTRDSKGINVYIKNGTGSNENINRLYNKYNDLSSSDYVLRIKHFLEMIKQMETHHSSVLKYMISDTYLIN